MVTYLLALAENVASTEPQEGSVLAEALRISGIGLLAIFFVMGLFAVMIKLFAKLFPDSEGKSKS